MSDDLTPDPRFAVGDRVTLSDNPDDPDLEGEAGEIKAMRYSQPKIAGIPEPVRPASDWVVVTKR
jgi:hypothetical protein